MIKPDVIVCWPRNCDYPLFREYIRNNRDRFNEVIIAITETNQGHDYEDFIREFMFPDRALFVDARHVPQGVDWRDYATNLALVHSYNSEWVWFTEQDFFPTQEFWDIIDSVNYDADVFAVYDGPRMHPCSLLMHRHVLIEITKNFGIVPDKSDHFGLIQKQLESQHFNIYKMPENTYKHMAGLSHNFTQICAGKMPNYKPEEFDQYLKDCLNCEVLLNPVFIGEAENYFLRSL